MSIAAVPTLPALPQGVVEAVQANAQDQRRRPEWFFDRPHLQDALRNLDGWGYVELGVSVRITARYSLAHHGAASESTWPSFAAMCHTRVDDLLGRMARPPSLIALLRHRYPRCSSPIVGGIEQIGVHHRNALETFIDPARRRRLMDHWGNATKAYELFLAKAERRFIEDLARFLRDEPHPMI